MKYLNGIVFLGLMIFTAGCQKKEKVAPKSPQHAHHITAKEAKAVKVEKQGPTKLQTKKSAQEEDHKKTVLHESKAEALKKHADNKKESVSHLKKNVEKKEA